MLQNGNHNIIIKGQTASEGIAIGPALVLDDRKKEVQPKKIRAMQIRGHLQRFADAKASFLNEIEELSANLDSTTTEIFEAQKHIISDVEIDKRINQLITDQQYSVDFAIYHAFSGFIERLKESGSELFRQRIIDLENLRDRLIQLSCKNEKQLAVKKGSVLIVREISPTDLVSYHEKGVIGLVMDKGGVTSHAAIIAQSLNIPCIVSARIGTKINELAGDVILDANQGELMVNPTRDSLSLYLKKQKTYKKEQKAKLKANERSETLDGYKFHLNANVDFIQELSQVKQSKAEGIGLLRTEALLYSGIAHKREADQIRFYQQILSKSKGEVTIRLFDVGGDKLNISAKNEDNPFLGWRGIRMLLDERELLQSQIRAILKVSSKYRGRIKILVPMVTVVEEIVEVKEVFKEVEAELIKASVDFDSDVKIGIMVEVPSVALLANHFAQQVDFISIGTNDLTQYTLAVDRGNERICTLYQQYHPAILHLVKLAATAAQNHGIVCEVCGELAGDPIGTAFLLGIGINNLSMSPTHIPRIKHFLSTNFHKDFTSFAQQSLQATSAAEVREHFEALF